MEGWVGEWVGGWVRGCVGAWVGGWVGGWVGLNSALQSFYRTRGHRRRLERFIWCSLQGSLL